MELNLNSKVQYIPHVGPAKADLLSKLGINTVSDLLFYAPFRYDDYSLVSKIADIQPGETITIKAKVIHNLNLISKTGKKIQKATVEDESGKIDIIWFNQPYLTRVLYPGSTAYFSGTAAWFVHKIALISPDYEIQSENQEQIHTGRLVPIYPSTEGLSIKWLRGRIAYIIKLGLNNLDEYLPPAVMEKYSLMNLSQALALMHFPDSKQNAQNAIKRLAFEELLALQIQLLQAKFRREHTQKTNPISLSETDLNKLISSFPFILTDDQKSAVTSILNDIGRSIPMNRILVGEVGSGKTIVAIILMYAAARSNLTSLIMAPTQILAQQHYRTIKQILNPFGIETVLVTSKIKPVATKTVANPMIYVGTHALLSESMLTENVGCIVIDEQQRFGVAQRQLLAQKSDIPHVLSMTATPIPRTIALTLFGNIDISIIAQMPKGRKQVKTWLVPEEKRPDGYNWIAKQVIDNKSQVFIVCPFIDESESMQSVKAAKKEYENLQKNIFPQLKIGLLHGNMKPETKETVLDQFKNGQLDMLVSTPVVEVGIDVPNATIMVIEAAERFGLSQLHQLRGRVGRGDKPSYCLLFTENTNQTSVDRLKSMETHHNGLDLAEIDLKLRGPGELLGTRQHGLPKLTYATFLDMQLIKDTREAAENLIQNDPDLHEFPLLREKLANSTIESSVLS